ncbi:MAG: arginine deiminase [Bacteroidales bacterium]|nr:arginine deiminase [Bacteroidales bacterium]
MSDKFNTIINSEIGELEGVIIHTPSHEIENMTPGNAERALYSDILNLSIASSEYSQFKNVLEKHTKTFEVKDLLTDILLNEKVKHNLIDKICKDENKFNLKNKLLSLNPKELTTQLIEGIIMDKNTLTNYLNKDRFSLKPLHNFFFTRDASVSIFNNVFISKMANKIRERESIIMEAIFDYHPFFNTKTINPLNFKSAPELTFEGGDVLVARDDVIIVGQGARTNSQGIDFIIDKIKENKEKKHIIVQELPYSPESFIHLDMVFTFLDVDKCMVYSPLIMKSNRFLTIHITVDNGKVVSIKKEKNIPEALRKIGMDIKTISCGGEKDLYIQEREQWHSGANFFALSPGKIIGYGRNQYTIEELNKNGFEIINAKDIIKNKVDIKKYDKYVVTIDGSELSRGGGGCRCMTMPVKRKTVKW